MCIIHSCLSWLQILGGSWRFLALCLRPKTSLAAENLFLRKHRPLPRAQGQAPTGRQSNPTEPGTAEPVVQLARRFDRRETQNLHHVAPPGLPPLLALEVRSRPASDTRRPPAADSQDGA